MILLLAITSASIVIAAVLAMLCVGFTTWAVVARRSPAELEVLRRLEGQKRERPDEQGSASADNVVRDASGGTLANRLSAFARPLEKSAYERNQLALKLTQAGIREPSAVTVFLGAKMLLMVVLTLAAFSYGVSRKMSALDLFAITIFGTVLGFYIPNIWLRSVVNRRSLQITWALPDSLDMLVIAVEAGLGLDAAIQRVGDEMRRTYPELAEEWIIACRETQMGIPRAEALRKMARRTNVPDMHALVAIVAQAERLGTSIAQTLRVHAETMRIKRRQRAEEAAAKTTVKLLFPLIFFLFPVIFVVIMGPAVINIMHSGLFSN